MKLSIIIVNYNVRYFLENCLHSVVAASKGLEAETIVVDNNSTDDSQRMMAELFPEIQYYYLKENLGFSKANNYGIEQSKGEYILLLNPDTLVAEDTFSKCIAFMDAHSDAGGLGVKMIDGYGHFLPESKRGLPTPKVSFYKIFGLSRLFPKSQTFGQYHLGYLNENETHEVDVLSGAFMLMRKSVLDKCGLLDEQFFMYGEDIDLSYRIQKAGYKNYYFPETQILHYKGESTKKGSLNYVFVFYRAMVIFAKKHFSKSQASLFDIAINIAIYLRATIALISRLFSRSGQVLLDLIFSNGIFMIVATTYAGYAHKDFSLPFISLAIPAYAAVLVIAWFFSGAYDRPFRAKSYFTGWLIGSLVLLALYALLPEEYRFSRAVILIGSLVSLGLGLLWRFIIPRFRKHISGKNIREMKRALCTKESALALNKTTLSELGYESEFLATLANDFSFKATGVIGLLNELPATVRTFRIDEVLFDISNVSFGYVIDMLQQVKSKSIQFKVVNNLSKFVLGSMDVIKAPKHPSGKDLMQVNIDGIKRNKRSFDVVFTLLALVFSPIFILLVDRKMGFIANIFLIAFGKRSWVQTDPRGLANEIPKLKSAPVYPMMHIIWSESMLSQAYDANVRYIRSYRFWSDFRVVWQHLPNLGD